MVENQDNYRLLINKLDEFIRKYYKNQLLRGTIYFCSLVLLLFLVASLTEYFFHLSATARTFFFYGFLLTTIVILIHYIIIPLVHIYKIGKVISHNQAAQIIGSHFHNVKDKLLNTLQLHEHAENEPGASKGLILASINQKITELKPVPFSSAIDLGQNKKYLKFLLPPLIVIIAILAVAPSLITESTARLIDHTTYYQKPLPFIFEIANDDLEVIQNEDFTLNVKVKGEVLPDHVFVQAGDNRIKLNKENNSSYNYTFKNVQKNIKFFLSGA